MDLEDLLKMIANGDAQVEKITRIGEDETVATDPAAEMVNYSIDRGEDVLSLIYQITDKGKRQLSDLDREERDAVISLAHTFMFNMKMMDKAGYGPVAKVLCRSNIAAAMYIDDVLKTLDKQAKNHKGLLDAKKRAETAIRNGNRVLN